jgi:FGGY-family pentulose kinase
MFFGVCLVMRMMRIMRMNETTSAVGMRKTDVGSQNGHYLSAGELVGTLCATAAADLGLPAGIAVGSGVIDAYAGWIGTVGARVSPDRARDDRAPAFTRLAAVAGTSTCHLAMSADPVFVSGVWGPYRDIVLPGAWMAEGGQSATGELLKHVVETHPAFPQAQSRAEASRISVYDLLNQRLRELVRERGAPSISFLARHVFFYGDLFGNRSPVADPRMTGAIIGLTGDISVDGLAVRYYAAMESIALQTRQIVETLNDAGHGIASIFMSGSQCQNDVLVRLIASACRLPVWMPRYVHAAVCLGAAMLGAKAASADRAGRTEDLWTIMGRMSQPGPQIRPTDDPAEAALLDVKYRVFLDQARTQREYRDLVDRATATAATT